MSTNKKQGVKKRASKRVVEQEFRGLRDSFEAAKNNLATAETLPIEVMANEEPGPMNETIIEREKISRPDGKVPFPTGSAFTAASAALAAKQVATYEGRMGLDDGAFQERQNTRSALLDQLVPGAYQLNDFRLNKAKNAATATLQDTVKERAIDFAIEKIERFVDPFKALVLFLKKEKAAAVVTRNLEAVDRIAIQVDNKLRIERQNASEANVDCFGVAYGDEVERVPFINQ